MACEPELCDGISTSMKGQRGLSRGDVNRWVKDPSLTLKFIGEREGILIYLPSVSELRFVVQDQTTHLFSFSSSYSSSFHTTQPVANH